MVGYRENRLKKLGGDLNMKEAKSFGASFPNYSR